MKSIYDYLIIMRKDIMYNDVRIEMYIIAKTMLLRGEM